MAHVVRVAMSVPASARVVAFVHDVCERSRNPPSEIARLLDLDGDEHDALVLLTKASNESLLTHVQRVIAAPGSVGRELALVIFAADLDDHVRLALRPDDRYQLASEFMRAAAR